MSSILVPLRLEDWGQWGNALRRHDAQRYKNALIDHDYGLPFWTPILPFSSVLKHCLRFEVCSFWVPQTNGSSGELEG